MPKAKTMTQAPAVCADAGFVRDMLIRRRASLIEEVRWLRDWKNGPNTETLERTLTASIRALEDLTGCRPWGGV